MLRYESFSPEVCIVLSQEVLNVFDRHRQLNIADREAGGQLFARFEGSIAHIEVASGPRPSDWRSRFGFRPNRKAEQKEIAKMFKHGLHYVGDWHTHPVEFPGPSNNDLESIGSTASKSEHELKGLLLLIVGNSPFPGGLYVSLHTGKENTVLTPTGTRT